jgi:hypothetical protein
LAVKPDEAIAFSLLQQIERFFNKKLKLMNLPYSFKIQFLNQSIFNSDEIANRISKAADKGMPVKMKYSSVLGLSPSDTLGLTYLEEDILELSNKVWKNTLISSNTQSVSNDEGGRPTNSEQGKTLDDTGQQTVDNDGNDR